MSSAILPKSCRGPPRIDDSLKVLHRPTLLFDMVLAKPALTVAVTGAGDTHAPWQIVRKEVKPFNDKPGVLPCDLTSNEVQAIEDANDGGAHDEVVQVASALLDPIPLRTSPFGYSDLRLSLLLGHTDLEFE